MSAPSLIDNGTSPTLPWWRVKVLWLVIAGPAIVVLAGIVTSVVAFRGADPVVTTPTAAEAARSTAALAQAPALQARNHAATAAGRH